MRLFVLLALGLATSSVAAQDAGSIAVDAGGVDAGLVDAGAPSDAVVLEAVVEPIAAVPALEPPQDAVSPVAPDVIEVTVVGAPLARTPGSAHVIRSSALERFNQDDPHAVLLAVPGVYVRGEDGVGLRPNIGIRGVDPDRSSKLTLMEDGVLFGPAPYSAPAAYYFPLITRMTQVRVVKGPGATSFGPQTIGGAVDLITRPIPASLNAGADLTLGSYWHRKAHVYMGNSDGRVGFLIEGVHLANDGFKELPDGGDTGFSRNEWMIKGAYNFDETGATTNELRLKLTYCDELSNETYLGISDADFRANPLQRYAASALDQMSNHRTSIVLTHVYEPSEHLSITTNVYRHDYSRTWRKVNRFDSDDIALFDVLTRRDGGGINDTFLSLLTGEQDSMGADQQLRIGPNERQFASAGVESRLSVSAGTGPLAHRVEAGFRFHYDKVNRRHSESPFDLVGGIPTLVVSDPINNPTHDVTTTRVDHGLAHALAANAADAVTWNALTITPGVRVEVMRLAYEDVRAAQAHSRWLSVVIPGVGAYYGITDDFGLLGGAYRGFSAPVPGLANTAGKDNEPELAVNYEAGVRYTRGTSRAELIGFYNDYSNMNGTCTASSSCPDVLLETQVNAGHARIFGIEALADHEIKLGAFRLPLSASYTLLQTEFLESFRSDNPAWPMVTKGDEMPYVPQHHINLSAGVEHKRAGGNVAMNYTSAMREVAGTDPIASTLHADAQVMVDVTARYQIFDNAQLYLNVRNIFDSIYVVSHRPFGARPNAPRWVQIGAKFDL